MTWINKTNDTFSFENPSAEHGTTPKSDSSLLKPGGSAAVKADQKRNLSPGPVGAYDWLNAADANKKIGCSYTHPAGTGESFVTVTCSEGYKVSSDGSTYYQAHTFKDSSLQHHDAEITLYIKSA